MPKDSTKKLLKMSDLIKRTGVQRQTIHFYINKGLLPPPLKTSKNMAYYEQSYVERINLIKELQRKRFLPLDVIREILARTKGSLSPSELDVIKLSGKGLIQSEELRREREPETLEQLSRRTGISIEEIREMERWEIISSTINKDGGKIFAESDIGIIEAFAKMREGGLTKERGFAVQDFRLHVDFINMLAIEEVKIFSRKFAERFPEDASKLLPQIAQNAIETINAVICHVRRKKILQAVQAFMQEADADANSKRTRNRKKK